MPEAATTFDVREISPATGVIDIKGDITAHSEDVLMDAYARASREGVKAIVLNFSALDYMNSGGIGLLVTLLVRAQRQHQRVTLADRVDLCAASQLQRGRDVVQAL